MTPTEINMVISTVQGLWPRLKWTADEQDLFEQRCGRINIDTDQAEAAIRNLKATSDKFPQIANLLKAMENAQNRRVVVADAPKSEACRLTEMARQAGLPRDAGKVEIVVTWWHLWAKSSKRTRGNVKQESYEAFRAEMMELAGAGEQETDENWYAIVEFGEQFEPFDGAGQWTPESVRARVGRMFKDATNGA